MVGGDVPHDPDRGALVVPRPSTGPQSAVERAVVASEAVAVLDLTCHLNLLLGQSPTAWMALRALSSSFIRWRPTIRAWPMAARRPSTPARAGLSSTSRGWPPPGRALRGRPAWRARSPDASGSGGIQRLFPRPAGVVHPALANTRLLGQRRLRTRRLADRSLLGGLLVQPHTGVGGRDGRPAAVVRSDVGDAAVGQPLEGLGGRRERGDARLLDRYSAGVRILRLHVLSHAIRLPFGRGFGVAVRRGVPHRSHFSPAGGHASPTPLVPRSPCSRRRGGHRRRSRPAPSARARARAGRAALEHLLSARSMRRPLDLSIRPTSSSTWAWVRIRLDSSCRPWRATNTRDGSLTQNSPRLGRLAVTELKTCA